MQEALFLLYEVEAAPALNALRENYPGRIYFITAEESGSPIKVGYSTNPENRLRELQGANAERLHIEVTMPGNMTAERRLHKHLATGRLRGEWFRHDTPGLREIMFAAEVFEDLPWDFQSPCVHELLAFLEPLPAEVHYEMRLPRPLERVLRRLELPLRLCSGA